MKKTVFSMIAIVALATAAQAQQAVAVLTHNGATKTFNGYNALQEAYKEAASGDLITLSSGTFGAITTIEKAIKIRGAGNELDTIYHTQPTFISGNMTLDIASNGKDFFQLEGVHHNNNIYYSHTQESPKFIKCRLKNIARASYKSDGSERYGTMQNAVFYHCKVTGQLTCGEDCSVTAINCYLDRSYSINDTTSTFYIHNCVIDYCTLSSSSVSNSIFCRSTATANVNLDSRTSLSDCLVPSPCYLDESRNTYDTYSQTSAVFKTYRGVYSDSEDFELLPEFNTRYGLYSGSTPYSPRVAGPHIKLMEVAPRSTEAGTLNVRMKIENTAN